jgi:hypothetical protein
MEKSLLCFFIAVGDPLRVDADLQAGVLSRGGGGADETEGH